MPRGRPRQPRGNRRAWWFTLLAVAGFALVEFYLSLGMQARDVKQPKTTPPAKYDPATVVAASIDTRKSRQMIGAIHNFLQVMPQDIRMQIFHTKDNQRYIQENVPQDALAAGRLLMTPMPARIRHINRISHSAYVGSRDFWEAIKGDKVLMMEPDARLCAGSDYHLEDFMAYDYIGAPWTPENCKGRGLPKCVGNSGLSLISKQPMLQLARRYPNYTGMAGVDMWLSKKFQKELGALVAPEQVAVHFSVEGVFNASHGTPFGVHKPKKWLKTHQWESLLTLCPEAEDAHQ